MPTLSPVRAAPALPFVSGLEAHGDRAALLTETGVLTYRELARRTGDVANELRAGEGRRLALVAAARHPDAIVAYLGALAAEHPVLLTAADDRRAFGAAIEQYDPDVVLAPGGDGSWAITTRRARSRHDLHPDLALLLSTSGSTGAAKSVRLSHENLRANAHAIATSLSIRSTDRAATILPIHYCYGLSVLHSHLLQGAGLIVTDRSVVDRCFWDRFREDRGTTLAGVPYTFDLLDRVGFADMDLPDLRLVTQAGGRLAPDRVRRYADLGTRRGWGFVVMYGQTEATARMAVLPPELASSHPGSIGRPIPGGAFRIEPVPGEPDGTGELVYHGPNVMLGYAAGAADLGLGRTVEELRTGDLARRGDDGLYEIVGRRSAFLKIAGLRIDLEQVERLLDAQGLRTCCTGDDDELVVGIEAPADVASARRHVLAAVALPPSAVRVVGLDAIPRLANGKPDRSAVRAAAVRATADAPAPAESDPCADGAVGDAATTTAPAIDRVRDVYRTFLERDVHDADTFVGLGGDSLSYVQVSLALQEVLGHLPPAWPSMSVRALAGVDRPRIDPIGWRRIVPRLRVVETGVVLRAVAILLIVSTHVAAIDVMGGAHVLLAVAGYNFARFQLTTAERRTRLRSQVRAIGRIVGPAVVWIAVALLLADDYEPYNLILGNAILGPERWASTWHFWFIEVLVYILAALAILSASPALDRIERRWPFGVAAAVLAAGLLTRSGVVELGVLHTLPVLWLFAIGWAASRARGWRQRLAVLVVAVAAVPGYFGDVQREAVIVGGLVLLILVPRIALPTWIARGAAILASASLYIYLVHWQVYPLLQEQSKPLAVVAALGAGIVAWLVATRTPRAARWGRSAVRRRSRMRRDGRPLVVGGQELVPVPRAPEGSIL